MPARPLAPAARSAGRYRAVNRFAVLSVVAGGLSVTAFLAWPFLVFPLTGAVLAWLALRNIARAREEYTGDRLAWIGLGLSVGFFLLGGGWLVFKRAAEVPHGYQRVDYQELQPDPAVAGEVVPPKAQDLDGKNVYIKGYMQPGRQQVRLKRFRLCPTNGQCAFCTPNPKPTEIIQVQLTGDLITDYTTQLVGVGGRLHVDPADPHHMPYSMEVDVLR